MLFDKFAKIIEKYYPDQWGKVVQSSRLFTFDLLYLEEQGKLVYSEVVATQEMELASEMLPFPVVVVETDRFLVLFDGHESHIVLAKADGEGYMLGRVTVRPEGDTLDYALYPVSGYDLRCKRVVEKLDRKSVISGFDYTLCDAMKSTVLNARYLLHQMYTMEDFIIECEPAKKPKSGRKGIMRSDKRSQFIVVSSKKYKSALNEDRAITGDDQVKIRSGGDRRAHWRTYTSERYKEMRGKRQRIAATWVGPSSYTKHGRIYKVRLDL